MRRTGGPACTCFRSIAGGSASEPPQQEINDLVATLGSLPQQHPLVTLLRGSRDAQNADALADALLNPRDRSYSVPQLFDFIDRNGMAFGRWYWQAPYLPQCGAIAATPHAEQLVALPLGNNTPPWNCGEAR